MLNTGFKDGKRIRSLPGHIAQTLQPPDQIISRPDLPALNMKFHWEFRSTGDPTARNPVPARLLILVGPSGIGKTEMMRQLIGQTYEMRTDVCPVLFHFLGGQTPTKRLASNLARYLFESARDYLEETSTHEQLEDALFSAFESDLTPTAAQDLLSPIPLCLYLDDFDKEFDGEKASPVIGRLLALFLALPECAIVLTCKASEGWQSSVDGLDELERTGSALKIVEQLEVVHAPNAAVATYSPTPLAVTEVRLHLESVIQGGDSDHRRRLIDWAAPINHPEVAPSSPSITDSFRQFPVLLHALRLAWQSAVALSDGTRQLLDQLLQPGMSTPLQSDSKIAITPLFEALIGWQMRGYGKRIHEDFLNALLTCLAAHRPNEEREDVREIFVRQWVRLSGLPRFPSARDTSYLAVRSDLVGRGILKSTTGDFFHDSYRVYFERMLDDQERTPLQESDAIFQTIADYYEEILDSDSGARYRKMEHLIYHLVRHSIKKREQKAFELLEEVTLHHYSQFRHSHLSRLRKQLAPHINIPEFQVLNLCEMAEIAYVANPTSEMERELIQEAEEIAKSAGLDDNMLLRHQPAAWSQMHLMSSTLRYEDGKITDALSVADMVCKKLSKEHAEEYGLIANALNHRGICLYKLMRYSEAISDFENAYQQLQRVEKIAASISSTDLRQLCQNLIYVDQTRLRVHVQKLRTLHAPERVSPRSAPPPKIPNPLGIQEELYRAIDYLYLAMCRNNLELAQLWWNYALGCQSAMSEFVKTGDLFSEIDVDTLSSLPGSDGEETSDPDYGDPWTSAYLFFAKGVFYLRGGVPEKAKNRIRIATDRLTAMEYKRDILFANHATWCCDHAILMKRATLEFSEGVELCQKLTELISRAIAAGELLAELAMRYTYEQILPDLQKRCPAFPLHPDSQWQVPNAVTVNGRQVTRAEICERIEKIYGPCMDRSAESFTPPTFQAAMLIFRSSPLTPTHKTIERFLPAQGVNR